MVIGDPKGRDENPMPVDGEEKRATKKRKKNPKKLNLVLGNHNSTSQFFSANKKLSQH